MGRAHLATYIFMEPGEYLENGFGSDNPVSVIITVLADS